MNAFVDSESGQGLQWKDWSFCFILWLTFEILLEWVELTCKLLLVFNYKRLMITLALGETLMWLG